METAPTFDLLIVDDDEALLTGLREVFQALGYRVETAKDGLDAIHVLSSGALPRLILLDLSMPTMSGREFLRIQQTYLRWSVIPVIVLTGTFRPVPAALFGVAAIATKDGDPAALIATVERLCPRPIQGEEPIGAKTFSPPIAQRSPEAPRAARGPTRVLVVDDNEQNRAFARMTLEDEGYWVLLASSGQEALGLFAQESPDCVLLDVCMPEMNGHTVCEHIRGMPGGAEVPVVFLTALRDFDTLERALKAGGTDVLYKPVQPLELALRVHQLLELRRLGATPRA